MARCAGAGAARARGTARAPHQAHDRDVLDVDVDLVGGEPRGQPDSALLGFPVVAALWITTGPADLHRVGETLAGHPEIAHAAATAGPSNLVATVVVRDTADLYAYLSGPLGHLEGVRHVEASPYLRRVKQLLYPRPVS